MVKKFLVSFREAHAKTGLTVYRVAKESGVNINTVMKYASGDVVVSQISPAVMELAKFYGLQWQDAIEVIDVEEDNPETRSALAKAS